MHAPIDRGNWDINTIVHVEAASVVASTKLLPARPRAATVYEIFSIRATMSEDGTGDLASCGISDFEVPVGATVGNTDGDLMQLRSDEVVNTIPVGSVYWHWLRSNQSALTNPTIYMPPGMFWDGEMHGVFQNGSGAVVTFLYTIQYRLARFAEKDFADVIAHILPRSATKRLTTTV